MTNHQAFRKFCHFLRKTGYYKEYWRLVYKIGLSKDFIKNEVNPSDYISRVDVSCNGVLNHIQLQEKHIEWRKELNPPKRKQLESYNSIPEDMLQFLERCYTFRI